MDILLISTLCVVIGLLGGCVIVDKIKYKKPTKKRYSKVIVGFVIVLNVLFTAAILYVFLQTASEPTTLVACWFAFTTGELWMLSSIKKTKAKKQEDEII